MAFETAPTRPVVASPAAVLASGIALGAALPGMPGGPVGSLTVGRARITLARHGSYRVELRGDADDVQRTAFARLDGPLQAFLQKVTRDCGGVSAHA